MNAQPISLGGIGGGRHSNNLDDPKKVDTWNPIRKQSPEERRQYMREYMREYRYQHPGLSTPYVRAHRARQRTQANVVPSDPEVPARSFIPRAM